MIRVRAPSRLHFGLLNVGEVQMETAALVGRFGGVGLMIEEPGIEVEIEPKPAWSAAGPMADRALDFARCFAESLAPHALVPQSISVKRAAPEHAGLGTGTQMGLVVAKALAVAAGFAEWDARELARRVGRGARSAVGVHGFDRGGFIFETGKWSDAEIAPIAGQFNLPDMWRIVLARPIDAVGIHGWDELAAFAQLALDGMSRAETLLRLITSNMIPALCAQDCRAFGEAVHEYNRRAGEPFAPAQGGPYACPLTAEVIAFLRSNGISGVGQSSWGPTVFAVVEHESRAEQVTNLLTQHFRGEIQALITRPSRGHVVTRCSSSSNSPVSS